ncbi:MAG TPA: hypothetical protein VMF11_00800 [Candidatus Baltobacteraceae bacterium]|nr:hypothetical protein [Candidatus Baltobacteraceae bacterium]
MSEPGAWPEGYAISRATLIDALRALAPLSSDGFILVGAQAVYLRSSQVELPIPAYTLDGDVVVDPRKIRRPRVIADSLEAAGFALRGHNGLYHRYRAPLEHLRATEIDVFVPARFDADWNLEGYNSRDVAAVMSQAGLELALVDHSPMPLEAISEPRAPLVVEVAGITALVVGKAWKLGERHAQGPEEFSKVAKDVLDVYRLLQGSNPSQLVIALQAIPRERRYSETAHQAVDYLRALCTQDGLGLSLLSTILGDGNETLIVSASLSALVDEFCSLCERHL